MYSRFQLARKYIRYYFQAANGKGHGVHSPFVFDMIKNVLNDKTAYPVYKKIEARRKELLKDTGWIDVEDFGAGSGIIKTNKRQVSQMAASSLKPKKYAQLLYRIVKYYQPQNIIELGTSFGITAAYIASGTDTVVHTLEGGTSIADIARKTLAGLTIKNAEVITGSFNIALPGLLSKIPQPGLVFIDGNHRKQPTLDYFDLLLKSAGTSTILIFDDIHWSSEMEEAWSAIKAHPSVTMTIDLFFVGIVLLRKDFKVKQHFLIRF